MKALIHIWGHDELCLQIDNYRSMLREGLTFKDVLCALGMCSDLYEISLECLDFQTYGTNGCSLTLEGTKGAIYEFVDLVHSDLGLEVLCNGTTVWVLDGPKVEHVWKTFCDRMPSRLRIIWAQGAVKPQTLLQLNLVAGGVKISYVPMWQQYSPELNAVTVYGADLNTSDCATLLRDKYFLENITRIESVAAANDEGESIFMCPIKELQITHVRKELCVTVSEEVVADYNKVARYSTIQKKDGKQEWLVDNSTANPSITRVLAKYACELLNGEWGLCLHNSGNLLHIYTCDTSARCVKVVEFEKDCNVSTYSLGLFEDVYRPLMHCKNLIEFVSSILRDAKGPTYSIDVLLEENWGRHLQKAIVSLDAYCTKAYR